MKLLHIDASILAGNSVSRQLSAAAARRLEQEIPGLEVTYRDLGSAPLSHLSGAHLAAAQGAVPETASVRDDIALSRTVLDEFLAADIVVIGAPMYNFTLPSQLKTWIDRILVAGATFKYTEKGVEGLAAGKRVIIAIARGGFYGEGAAAAAAEHLESYLHVVFGFIGIKPEIILAEGLKVSEEQRTKAVTEALEAAERLKAA